MAFAAFTVGEVDVNSPLNELFFGKMKDNFDDYDDHIHDGNNGDGGAIPTAGIANNAVTSGKIAELVLTSGINTIIRDDIVTSTGSGTLVIIKAIRIHGTGTVTVSFTMEGIGGSNDVSAQIYKNGVAVGTLRTDSSGNKYTPADENIAVARGDRIQIYARQNSATTVEISKLEIKVDQDLFAPAIVFNLPKYD